MLPNEKPTPPPLKKGDIVSMPMKFGEQSYIAHYEIKWTDRKGVCRVVLKEIQRVEAMDKLD